MSVKVDDLMQEMQSPGNMLSMLERAGESIMDYYQGKNLDIHQKEDLSPVTQADLESNKILLSQLPNVADIPILSEETITPWSERKNWEKFWLVDPLDGTKGFIQKEENFTVNITLVEKNTAVFGILLAPVSQIFYYAGRGCGAYRAHLSDYSNPTALCVQKSLDSGISVVSSKLFSGGKTEKFISSLPGVKKHYTASSAIKFGLIAEGSFSLYPRFSPTSLWDVAAGQCIVEEAGGMVLDANMQPMRYNHRENLLNPSFIACAEVHEDWKPHWQEFVK